MKIGDLELDLNHFFRYIYGGLISLLIARAIFPAQFEEIYEILDQRKLGGGIFFPMAIIALGAAFYVFYKVVISELIIGNFHLWWPPILLGHSPENCVFHYLHGRGVLRQQFADCF